MLTSKKRLWLWAPTVVAGLVAFPWLVSSLTVAKWTGAFTLSITVKSDPPVSPADLRFATALTRAEANGIVANGSKEDFSPPTSTHPLQFNIKTFGSRGTFEDTYYYDRFLIVQYAHPVKNAVQRTVVKLPPGRGNRSITIDLP